MSVINQMLKDLDKRQHEAEQAAVVPQTNVASKSPIHWVYIVVGILMLNAGGWYVWSLYSEVQSLKNVQASTIVKQSPASPASPVIETDSTRNASSPEASAEKEKVAIEQGVNSVNGVAENALAETVESSEQQVQQIQQKAQTVAQGSVNTNGPSSLPSPEVANNKPFNPESNDLKEATSKPTSNNVDNEQQSSAKLSISRREFTPEEFVANKYLSAEKAVQRNELAKAEKALEEVLLVDQRHKAARKQLAALWFGRQSYQAAINLLAQGLALDHEDSEMRMMQARIYLSQGDSAQALERLKVQVEVPDKEYQSLLASVAQQVGDIQTALAAYKQLTLLEPQSGKWWLGLAVAHDRGAEFDKARQAYQMAIAQRGLSSESLVFAQQRISELGE
ncbi:tetratricopeptide repeat protein [Thalassotalea fusca]